MIVCSCNVLTDSLVRERLEQADVLPKNAREVYAHCGCAPQCGRCARSLDGLLRDEKEARDSAAALEASPVRWLEAAE